MPVLNFEQGFELFKLLTKNSSWKKKGLPEEGVALRVQDHPSADVWVLCKNRPVSDRASFAVPGQDARTFYLCANPVFLRLCGKIETFAMAHGPEKSICLLASTKVRIARINLVLPVLNVILTVFFVCLLSVASSNCCIAGEPGEQTGSSDREAVRKTRGAGRESGTTPPKGPNLLKDPPFGGNPPVGETTCWGSHLFKSRAGSLLKVPPNKDSKTLVRV